MECRLLLGVNIDHAATVRQARYRTMLDSPNAEPDPVAIALAAEAAGADSITAHLRADRRHIQDDDVFRLREAIATKLNFEMGVTQEILSIALELKPEDVCLVPEEREEVTTEGGLDVAGAGIELADAVGALRENGTQVSMFIDPELDQVEASAAVGADAIELHTGTFANAAPGGARGAEVARLVEAAHAAQAAGLQVNAGHGLTTANVPDLFPVPHLCELNIGHHLISRALLIGIGGAIAEMREVMCRYPGSFGPGCEEGDSPN